jgi:hypothetical protein
MIQPRLIWAFGVGKTIKAWSEDPRCALTEEGLYTRLRKKDMAPEDAITMPLQQNQPKEYEAFGEVKTALAWSQDERCVVTVTTLKKRLQMWPVEKALTHRGASDIPDEKPVENPTPSRTYVNAGMARADGNLMKFSEPARGAAAMYAYQLPSKGLST